MSIVKHFLLLLSVCCWQPAHSQEHHSYDIVIYGGTSAGVMAAVQAANMGRQVVLVCPEKHLGGLSSSGLGWTDLGKAYTIGGLSRKFYQAVYTYYLQDSAWKQETRDEYIHKMKNGASWDKEMVPANGIMTTFEPHVAEKVFSNFIRNSGVTVKLNNWLNRENGVKKTDGSIKSIQMLNGDTYTGKVFIDATYEGDLMAAAGVSYTIGRESNATYHETANGIQSVKATKNQLPPGISPYIVSDDSTSGLLPGINPNPGGTDGSGDNKIQAYCYRMCLTNDAANRIMVSRPDNYHEKDFEILLRAAEKGWPYYFKFDKMPNRKTDSNNSGGISTDYPGMNYHYPEASYAERKLIEEAHRYWQQGSLWTLQHNSRVPDSIKQKYASWGLSQNEFTDNGYWPYQIYVREARRMVSDVVITEHHCLGAVRSPKPIAMGSYSMDSHNTQRYVAYDSTGRAFIRNEGDIQNAVVQPYLVDYGSIVPRSSEAKNIIVPVCLSASHIAYGSIRMEPVFMMLGQAAGAAAALAIDQKTSVQQVPYRKLRKRLLKDQVILDLNKYRN